MIDVVDISLARLALAAYAEPPDMCGLGPYRGTNAIVRELDGAKVIAFRGTDDPGDWLLDFMALPTFSYDRGALAKSYFVHHGFELAAASLYDKLPKDDRPTILTGHSLGGAIALVVGSWLTQDRRAPVLIVTYGAPRVGFAGFTKSLDGVPVRQYRRGNDPVPTVPVALPLFPYQQVTTPLIEIGAEDPLNPFSCHRMMGYVADLTAGA